MPSYRDLCMQIVEAEKQCEGSTTCRISNGNALGIIVASEDHFCECCWV